jgi:hypothetical protein
MKTDTHFWSHLAHFFLERDVFQTKVVEEIKTHLLYSILFYHAICEVMWKKYCRNRQATETHAEYVILTAFPCQQ